MAEANRRYSYGDISNGALILSLLRHCKNFEALCGHFKNADPVDKENTVARRLRRQLRELHDAGLVQFKENKHTNAVVALKTTELWSRIAVALGGLSITEVAMLSGHGKGMGVEPVFGRPQLAGRGEKRVDVFVLMPFKADPGKLYWERIKAMGKELKIKIERSDERYKPGVFFQEVWNGICAARLILAICSEINQNVFYEIGIAHAVGKKVVLLTHAELQIPSDIEHFNRIEYSEKPGTVRAMLELLRDTLQTELGLVGDRAAAHRLPSKPG